MLAKLGRVLVIAEEMRFADYHLDHHQHQHHGYEKDEKERAQEAKEDAELFHHALKRLEEGVAIWLNGQADSPMVFDSAWGGVFGCGCDYQPQEGAAADVSWCGNAYPNCPAVVDAGVLIFL